MRRVYPRGGTAEAAPAAVQCRKGLRAMYHYDPQIALEDVKEDAVLPHPVHLRDMMLRAHLSPEQAVELNRLFQEYLDVFGAAQKKAQSLLQKLVGAQA
jgi:hypothetical protein